MRVSLTFGILFLLLKCKNIIKKRYYCPICKHYSRFEDFGIKKKRKNVLCPVCGSLERHRFLYNVYNNDFLNSKKNIRLLHTAPEKCFSELILRNNNIEYFPIDINPCKYNYVDCIKADVTDLHFNDNTFDVIISNHVMEHVDDRKFLNEMLRTLKPGGRFYLTFPIFFDLENTLDNPNITTEQQRLKYYGQADHLRKYGRDIVQFLIKEYNADFYNEGGGYFIILKGIV